MVKEGSKLKLELDAKLENLSVISSFICEAMRQAGVDSAAIPRIQLAVDEACTNVALYAYPPEQPGIIRVSCGREGDDFVVTIEDAGKPFNPCEVPAPKLDPELDERAIGGLGIYLMRKVMDNLSYSYNTRTGNRLTMRKHVGAVPKKAG